MNIFIRIAMVLTAILATLIAGLVTIIDAWKPNGQIDHETVYGGPTEQGAVRVLTRKPRSPALLFLQVWVVVEVTSSLIILIVFFAGSEQDAG